MEAWQDRYGSLAGQKRKSWQIFYNFYIFSAIFGCFLPHIPVFPPFLLVFQPFICHFCQFAEQFGRVAWHSSLAEQNWGTWPPLTGKFFGRKGLNFGRTEEFPPENDPARPMLFNRYFRAQFDIFWIFLALYLESLEFFMSSYPDQKYIKTIYQ